jgi:hypothetical protein
MSAYTFRAAGTVASNANGAALSPGAPAGVQVGDLLLMFAVHRAPGDTVADITGWERIVQENTLQCLEVHARIADGTADDTPSVDWSGTGGSVAWLEARYGDVYSGALSGLIVDGPATAELATQSAPCLPTLTITGSDRLVILFSVKNKTTASDDATLITAPGSYTKRQQFISSGIASGQAAATADLQQTTAVNYDGTDFTINGTVENATSTGIVFSIQTSTATPPKLIVARSNIRLN